MENINVPQPPKPEDLAVFAIVCDNEVVSYIHLLKKDELHLAVYRSQPIFIEVPFDGKPPIGALWDGKAFKVQDWQ